MDISLGLQNARYFCYTSVDQTYTLIFFPFRPIVKGYIDGLEFKEKCDN